MTTTSTHHDAELVPADMVLLPRREVQAVQQHLRKAAQILDNMQGDPWMQGMTELWLHVSEADDTAVRWEVD